jgi:sugar lactone lactonase YvrE
MQRKEARFVSYLNFKTNITTILFYDYFHGQIVPLSGKDVETQVWEKKLHFCKACGQQRHSARTKS